MIRPTIAPLIHMSIILGLFLNVKTCFTSSAIADLCSLLGNFSYVYRELSRAGRSHTKHDGRAAGSCSLCIFASSLWP